MATVEAQLIKLIQEGKRLTANDDFESCTQWVDREIARTKKFQDQIERLQKSQDIPSKLFNEARDMGDELQRRIERLRSFRSNMSSLGRQVVLNTYEDARNSDILKNASVNTEFKCPW